MEQVYNLGVVLAGILPVFSGMTWVLVMIFSLQNFVTKFELRVKQTLLCFILLASLRCLIGLIENDQLQFYSYITPVAMATSLFAAVFYYKFILLVTKGGECDFSNWHYIVPSIIFVLEIVRNIFISHYTLPERLLELIYTLFYLILSLRLLMCYYNTFKIRKDDDKKRLNWVILLGISPFVSTIMYIVSFMMPSTNRVILGVLIILIVIFVLVNSMIAYAVLSRRFLFYTPSSKHKNVVQVTEQMAPVNTPKRRVSEVIIDDSGHKVVVKLTQKRLEEYMHKNKPYLNPQLKITDLIEPLRANRTFISNFVNKTYGLNFNQYINSLRLKELERISNLPSNEKEKRSDLILKVGFATMRNYTRALNAMQNTSKD